MYIVVGLINLLKFFFFIPFVVLMANPVHATTDRTTKLPPYLA